MNDKYKKAHDAPGREQNVSKKPPAEDASEMIIGRNAVSEAFSAGRPIDSVFVSKGEKNGTLGRLVSMAKEKGAVVKEVDVKKLDSMCRDGNHQGIICFAAAHEYAEIEDIFTCLGRNNTFFENGKQ